MTFERAQKIFKADTIREDGRLERHCEHGVGHPVGHINWRMLDKNWIWVHGCCAEYCCREWPTEEIKRDENLPPTTKT